MISTFQVPYRRSGPDQCRSKRGRAVSGYDRSRGHAPSLGRQEAVRLRTITGRRCVPGMVQDCSPLDNRPGCRAAASSGIALVAFLATLPVSAAPRIVMDAGLEAPAA